MTETIELEVREKDAERLREVESHEPSALDQIEAQVIRMVTEAYHQLPNEDAEE